MIFGLTDLEQAGKPKPDNQGVGSLILVDAIIANTPQAIVTTLVADHATSFLLQNVGFFNTRRCVEDLATGQVLLDGGDQLIMENWGFGRLTLAGWGGSDTVFTGGARIPVMKRNPGLVGNAYPYQEPNLFTRRRPQYLDVPATKVMNVKALGAKGDGVTDDTDALNSIIEGAANTSSVVFIPYGVYIVTDTLRVPAGSRIIGQVWPQIMGTGDKVSSYQPSLPDIDPGPHSLSKSGRFLLRFSPVLGRGPPKGCTASRQGWGHRHRRDHQHNGYSPGTYSRRCCH